MFMIEIAGVRVSAALHLAACICILPLAACILPLAFVMRCVCRCCTPATTHLMMTGIS
jgi:hypothetical protein